MPELWGTPITTQVSFARHCLAMPPSGMASHSSSSDNQYFFVSWRVLIFGKVQMWQFRVLSVASLIGILFVKSPGFPKMFSL
jgi:hypothetical protein